MPSPNKSISTFLRDYLTTTGFDNRAVQTIETSNQIRVLHHRIHIQSSSRRCTRDAIHSASSPPYWIPSAAHTHLATRVGCQSAPRIFCSSSMYPLKNGWVGTVYPTLDQPFSGNHVLLLHVLPNSSDTSVWDDGPDDQTESTGTSRGVCIIPHSSRFKIDCAAATCSGVPL